MITPTTKSLPARTVQRMREIASYLSKRGEIKSLYPIVGYRTNKNYDDWNLVGQVLDSLHIKTDFSRQNKYANHGSGDIDNSAFFNYYRNNNLENMNITGYSYFSNLETGE